MTATLADPGTLADLVTEVGGRIVCLALSKDPNAKVTILLFRPGEYLPCYAAKIPTTDAAVLSVRSEAARLGHVGRREIGRLAATIPQVVAITSHAGRPVLVTTALPGRVMLASYHAWRHTAHPAAVLADFDAAGRWLAELQHRTARGRADLACAVGDAAEAITRRFGDDDDLAGDLELLAGVQDRLAGQQVPRVVMHGDFWPGNLLVAGGQVTGVIDWECARTDGLPTRDLARFVIAYSLYLDRHTRPGRRVPGHQGLRAGPWGAGLDYAISGTGWYPELAQRFVADGLRRLGVPPDRWRDVVLAEIACVAAEADHPDFARNHLQVLRRLRPGSGL